MVLESKLVNPDRQIDCTGLFCPMPIVKTREAMKQMVVGEILEMLSDDPAAEADMRSWSRSTGHDLVEVGRSGLVYRFMVRKTR
jgi:tRNA 2-thiouridine synthesizing protein A